MQALDPSAPIAPSQRLRLDLVQQQLWRNGRPVALRPKAWQALTFLAQRPGELVRSDELLDALWPGQDVSAKTMANLIGELRIALGDEQAPPQLLQTVHRRGYRLQPLPGAAGDAAAPTPAVASVVAAAPVPLQPRLVGRQAELARLHQLLGQAGGGQRQLVLLAGDAGVGKTALLDQFAAGLADTAVLACRGACLEQRSEHEPFAPVLGLLSELCSGALAGQAGAALRRCAPTWLAQLPWLVQPHEIEGLRTNLAGMGTGRMLREFGALLHALCSHTPLVLLFEDLQWADPATIDLLLALAADRTPARVMVVASYQPALARLGGHPVADLAARLTSQGQATLLALQPLDTAEVGQVIAGRFGNPALAGVLQHWAQRQSSGNPLYLHAALNHLVACGALVWQQDSWQLQALPCAETLAGPVRPLISAGFARLAPATRSLLEAASVVGMQVAVPLLAAALEQDPAEVEQACNLLARQGQYLLSGAVAHWPDGSSAGTYSFSHDIYRRALYDGLAPAQRQALHRRVALRLEAGWAGHLAPVAGQLAAAYSRAAMPEATARVLEMTAHLSAQRFAWGEAIAALQGCLEQLDQMPDAAEHASIQLRVNLMLANISLNHQGLGGPLALPAFERACSIARRSGAVHELIRAQLGATIAHAACFRPQQALQLGLDTVALAEAHAPMLLMAAHHYTGMAQAINGDLPAARHHQTLALGLQPEPLGPLSIELRSSVKLHLGITLCHMGEVERGLDLIDAGLARARRHSTPADLLHKLFWAGDACRMVADARAGALLQEVVEQAETFDLPGLRSAALIRLACLPPRDARDADQIERLFQEHARSGDAQAVLVVGISLAEAHLTQGRPGAARAAWARARAVVPAGALFDCDLLRLQAKLLDAEQAPADDVAASFRAGIEVARRQQAHLQGRRCAAAWSRWLQRQGRPHEAAVMQAEAPALAGFSPDAAG